VYSVVSFINIQLRYKWDMRFVTYGDIIVLSCVYNCNLHLQHIEILTLLKSAVVCRTFLIKGHRDEKK
jgi:hypothetical protein